MKHSLPGQILLGTRNAKKKEEIRSLFSGLAIDLLSLADFPDAPEVIEDGETFAANAAKKAVETAVATAHWVLAEDSGLCVDALGGAPGVYSARFAGEPCDDRRNNSRLVAELTNVASENRTAHYICHVALSDPSGAVVLTAEARCRGRIVLEPRGTNGFGYDPHFLIPEYHRTFGELSPLVKRVLSHRARALTRFVQLLRAL